MISLRNQYPAHRTSRHGYRGFALEAGIDSSNLTKDQIEDLEAKFAEQQTIINLCCIFSGLAFLFLTHALLVEGYRWLERADGIAGYKIPYQTAIWWFFPGFGALCLCFEITLQVWAIFAGCNVVELYVEWDSRQPKKSRGRIVYYDARKILRWLALVIALPIGIFTTLALNMHATFSADGVHEFGYAFAKPSFHSYRDIRRITRVDGIWGKHSKFIPRPSLVLDFTDGNRWSQARWDDSRSEIEVSLATMLQRKTQVAIGDAFRAKPQ